MLIESQYESLSLHTEIKGLFRGKVLCRFLNLKNKSLTFFQNDDAEAFLKYYIWCWKMTYSNSTNRGIERNNNTY
ncbi:hypothetical protein HZS_7297 [Henneguya salminicola]|nr:hypothetical protein HZS_7297 [Henneguya salminicola]